MNHQFCTSCGIQTRVDQKHCEECGHRLNDDSASNQSTESTNESTAAARATAALRALFLPVNQKHSTLFTWLEIGIKTLAVGLPLAALFDFLSPRVSLLPIAATFAVVGLLTTIALRKFVAPSLPPTSKLRRALAPEEGIFKSRLLIGTYLLSALMVTGAAWSTANAPEGGIIASKFDSARVAQLQVGILKGMQKEQRQQTAVLEDIREGRASDPRRELSNIGAGFSEYELDAAIDRGDLRTIRLLFAGGIKWRVSNAYAAFASSNNKISTLLLENMLSFELRAGDCERLIEQKFGMNRPFEMIGGVMQPPIDLPGKSPIALEPFQIRLLTMFCVKPDVQAFVKGKLTTEQQNSALASLNTQKTQLGLNQSRETCVRNINAKRADKLNMRRIYRKFDKGPITCVSSDCSSSIDRLSLSLLDEKKYAQVAQEVCLEEYPLEKNNGAVKVRDLSQTYQQILDLIS